jgi:dTDP-3-amino-3,4,6-trideoxy-alpha-D-glucose transaminase
MTTAVPFGDLRVAASDVEMREAISAVCDSGHFILGEQVDAFEREFAAFAGTAHCVGVNSGTDALALTLHALGATDGAEVIVPAYTAVATWMAVVQAGARPVGVDVTASYGMDADAVACALTPTTKAIIPVHLLGRACDVASIVAAAPGVPVIEDTAQAHGARNLDGTMCGSVGVAGAFSFYPTKNLGCLGDGGAVVTDDGVLADRVRMLRSYGWRTRNESLIAGGNSRLDEMQAAVLRVRLRRLDAETVRRRAIAEYYSRELIDLHGVEVPGPDWRESVWHLYVIRVLNPDAMIASLAAREVTALRHYWPIPPRTPAFAQAESGTEYPVADRLASSSISLPLFPSMTDAQVEAVVDAVRQVAQPTGGR